MTHTRCISRLFVEKEQFKKKFNNFCHVFFWLYWCEKLKFDVSNTWNRWQRWFRNEQNFQSIWMIREFLLFNKLKKLRKIRSHIKILWKNNTFEEIFSSISRWKFQQIERSKVHINVKIKKFYFQIKDFQIEKKIKSFSQKSMTNIEIKYNVYEFSRQILFFIRIFVVVKLLSTNQLIRNTIIWLNFD